MTVSRPILLNSCARAATAAEARFRINAPIAPTRATRVVALDEGAVPVIRNVAGMAWQGARFFIAPPPTTPNGDGGVADVALLSLDGTQTWLSDELTGADVAVMVATANDGAAMASAIGDGCTLRGIMTAGIVLADGRDTDAAVSALRPHARVLLVTRDENDVAEVLTALRA